MPVDPSVIAALTIALAGDPDNVALRMHLAALLEPRQEPDRRFQARP